MPLRKHESLPPSPTSLLSYFEECLTSDFMRRVTGRHSVPWALLVPLFLFLHSVDMLATYRIVGEIIVPKELLRSSPCSPSGPFMHCLFLFSLWYFETGSHYVAQGMQVSCLGLLSAVISLCCVAPRLADFLLLKYFSVPCNVCHVWSSLSLLYVVRTCLQLFLSS